MSGSASRVSLEVGQVRFTNKLKTKYPRGSPFLNVSMKFFFI